MNNKILIFTPTYNESENITEFISSVDSLGIEADILIIDDNSPDNTWKIIEEHKKNKKNLY